MNCLLEVGIENFPSQYLDETLKQLDRALNKFLDEYRVSFSNLKIFGTSRRFVLKFEILKDVQERANIEILGPSAIMALDEKGNFNNLAKAFANSKNCTINDLKIKETIKGKYIYISREVEEEKVENILPQIFQKTISSLEFNKTMIWNSFNFIRPISWLLSFIDNKILNFKLGDIHSSNFTYPNRSISLEKVTICSYEDYFNKIENLGVILSSEERKSKIINFLEDSVKINNEVVNKNANVCEFPNPLICSFDESFLDLPSEVIVRTLEEYQNAIPIFKFSKLSNNFVVVRDGININREIKRGNERVVKARLRDAQFFYNEDIKHPLEYYNRFLDTILFHKNLGNMRQKVERLVNLSANFSYNNLIKSAGLCKADLATNIIKEKEYKILRGYIGMHYANTYGEEISKPIFEHYLPRFRGDMMPSSLESALLSIIDKVDNIVAINLLDSLPTGAKDPFYIRREVIAIIEVILKFNLDISLTKMLQNSFEEYKNQKLTDKDFDLECLKKFIKSRVESYFTEFYPRVLVNSINQYDNIKDFNNKLEVLNEYYEGENFKSIVEVSKRVKNITKNFNFIDIDENLFNESERSLYKKILNLEKIVKERNYEKILGRILDLKGSLDEFFCKVVVNVEDILLKNNRLSLLKKIDELINSIANISEC